MLSLRRLLLVAHLTCGLNGVQLVFRNGVPVSRGPEREVHHGRFTVIAAAT